MLYCQKLFKISRPFLVQFVQLLPKLIFICVFLGSVLFKSEIFHIMIV